MKTLFLSHNPHPVHLNFARGVGSRIAITPFNFLVDLRKRWKIIDYFYPFLALAYSFFLKIDEGVVLADGGSSLWIGAGAKMKNPRLKFIYLDADLCIFRLTRASRLEKTAKTWAFKKIDAIISVSKMSKKTAEGFLSIPVKVCPPYAQSVSPKNIERKNYGLFVGRLDPDKNIMRIIEFGLQCDILEKIVVVGTGFFEKKIRALAKANNKIQFAGHVDDLGEYYSRCKFLLHLPDFDPHPCVTMEAALCGCFPIVSKNTGSAYLFDPAFTIDDPADFLAINKRIEFILANEEKFRQLLKLSQTKMLSKKESISNFKNTFKSLVNS
jgi:glycosyltransferase involved in cell wall biosynthesis